MEKVLAFFFFLVLTLFDIVARGPISKKTILGGPTFSRGAGVQLLIPIETNRTLILQ